MLDAYLYLGLRTPFGRHGGALATLRADDLAAAVVAEVVARAPFPAGSIEDVILGCANQAGEDSRNVARNAILASGLPISIPGQTVNRLCASGLAAVIDAARAVTAGEGEIYLAGGVESMSRAPFVMGKAESAWQREMKIFDSAIGARFANPRTISAHGADSMPETGDNVAREFFISREDADAFAAASQTKFAAARAAGFFAGEIIPIEVPTGRKSPPKIVSEDEHPRPGTNAAQLAGLNPLYAGGVVTPGNASGLNDGAAAMFVASRAAGARYGAKPLARILASAAVGVAPRIMGVGPAYAIPRALDRAGLALAQMDIVEINEAFATQALSCLKLLGIAFDDSRVNPHGGAIAVGHPLGASGARLMLSTARALHEQDGRYAVVSLCIGMGQGLAVVIERVED